jgi:hypothetical protein
MTLSDFILRKRSAVILAMTMFALLLTVTFCTNAALAQSTTFHRNGAFASAFDCIFTSPTVVECFDVEVGDGTGGTTILIYLHIIADATGAYQAASGSGLI